MSAAIPSAGDGWRLGTKAVNRVGFGAMRLTGRIPFGAGSPEDHDKAIHVLQRAADLGVNHFDTAAYYRSSLESANELIRTALWPYRSDTFIATKVRPAHDADGISLRGQIEENLRDLRLDCLDLVYLRVGKKPTIREEFAELSAMRDSGLIQHLGLSGVAKEQFDEVGSIAPVTAIQNRYGIGVRRDDSVFRAAALAEIAFVPFFSIAAEGKHKGPMNDDPENVRRVANAHGVSVAAVRIAWTLGLGANVLAIPGTGSPEHLEENVAAGRLRLTDEDIATLGGVAPLVP
jgi:aryl-alcohol dehydrogenase-like predicted oxidoreductase